MNPAEKRSLASNYVQKHSLNSKNINREHLKAMYCDMKLPLEIVAEQFHCSPRTISNWLTKYGIKKRSVGEARSVHLRHDFFKTWSPAMAWVLGLCFTDGSFYRNQIALRLNDRETLEKVKSLVGPYLTIYERPQSYDKSNLIYSLTFGNEEMAKDLLSLGITSKKSLTMKFPNSPEPYIRDFIRGCWDGDGGFSLNRGKLFAHYTCGSRQFIETIAQKLYAAGINRTILRQKATEDIAALKVQYGDGPYPLSVYERSNAKAYDIRFAADMQLVALYKYLYKEVDSSIYMERKHSALFYYVRRLLHKEGIVNLGVAH